MLGCMYTVEINQQQTIYIEELYAMAFYTNSFFMNDIKYRSRKDIYSDWIKPWLK